jgi:ABC-type branched-subunit amino acid transport system substrate-binding protein
MKKMVTIPLISQLVVLIISGMFLFATGVSVFAEETVKIGLNYPETGNYAKQGIDEKRAADLAVEEINAAGGILGKKIQLVYMDSQANAKIAKQNAINLFDKDGVQMLFGGSSSAEAIADGKVALQKNKLYFGTLTYSTATTGEEGHKNIFRESYDSYMAAKVLANYLNQNFGGKKYFYITSDYTWGWTTEDAFRKFTNTNDKTENRGVLTSLGSMDYKDALNAAKESNAQVLVLTEFGRDMEIAVKQAYEMGLKKTMQIIVPNLTLDMAEGAGPEAMEGIIGAEPWNWTIPFKYNYPKGIAFINKFEKRYKRYPSEAGGSAYVILYEYKDVVERAGTFDTKAVIKALEGHKYTGLKDEQYWRDWDHQSVQTVYAVKCKPAAEVRKDKYQEDYFEIINTMKGDDAAIGQKEWTDIRAKVGMPAALEEAK